MKKLPGLWPSATILACLTASCAGGGGSSAAPAEPPTDPVALAAALTTLGVDITQTPRIGEAGTGLEDYSPLGTVWDASSPAELLVAGIPMKALKNADLLWFQDAGVDGPDDLKPLADADAPWVNEAIEDVHVYASKRAFVTADLDGDGFDEVAAVRIVGGSLFLETWEDLEDPGKLQPDHVQHYLGDFGGVLSVSLAAGDFDGDAHSELLVGYTYPGSAVVEIYDESEFGYAVIPGSTRVLAPQSLESSLSLVLAAGNMDEDQSYEAVVVLNEHQEGGGSTAFLAFDDVGHDFAELFGGPVEHVIEDDDGNFVGVDVAVVASATFGDFDGDGFDELALGGLTDTSPGQCEPSLYVGMAYEDLLHGGALYATTSFLSPWFDCEDNGFELGFAHLLAADIDGNLIDELVINRHVLQLDPEAGELWTPVLDGQANPKPILLPEDAFFEDQNTGPFTRSTSTMAVGDIMANGREEILILRQGLFAGVRVFGQTLDLGGDPIFEELGEVPGALSDFDPGKGLNPIILTPDCDNDSITMVREDVEHEVVFTEPIVLAVLAAPPTVGGVQQNYADSVTTYGNTTSSGSSQDATMTYKASAHVGIKFNGGLITQSGFEMKATVTAAASATVGTAYNLSESVFFTTGAQEDSVVFTCIPMDRYIYRVVRHYDEELLDAVVTVDLPRTPVTIQVEREFYNESIAEGAPVINASVLQHTVGDITSYPTKAKKVQLVLGHDGISASSTVNVGAGSGSSTQTLELEESTSFEAALELGFEFAMETTAATVTAGFSVGSSSKAAFQTSIGSSTSWSGTVGDIAPVDFPDNSYQYGLFTYYYSDPVSGQKFQVVNYWVE